MPKFAGDVRSLARTHTESCIRSLAGIAARGESEAARVAAIGMLLDRGWGKAATTFGLDGEGDIRVVIRHIVEGRDGAPAVIEHKPSEEPPG